MENLALYRKYRPDNFKDITGQDSTVLALSNAIAQNRLSHSYLFYGPRGTGKTTTARILAKVANCIKRDKNLACKKCVNCRLAQKNSAFDILEIDAASNTGVDSIRAITEKIKILPIQGKYKFYIIDEIHMLSNSAFNALLKTLEEPPAHIIFILATTEYYKVPVTVRSRCQQYEFKLISEKLISEKLIQVLKTEKISFDKEAISAIYQLSGGSLRDALTVLEKIIIFSNHQKITLKNVNTNFGLVKKEQLIKFLTAILQNDLVVQLDLIKKFKNENLDCYRFLWQLIENLKQCLEFKITNQTTFLNQTLIPLQDLIIKFKTNTLSKLISLLFTNIKNIKLFSRPWFYLELSLMTLESSDQKEKKLIKNLNVPLKITSSKKPIKGIQSAQIKDSISNLRRPSPKLAIIQIWKQELEKFKNKFHFNSEKIDDEYLQEWAYKIWFNNESKQVPKINDKINTFFKSGQDVLDLISLYKTKVIAKYKNNIIIMTENQDQMRWVYYQLYKSYQSKSVFSRIFENKIINLVAIVFSKDQFRLIENKFKNRKLNRQPLSDLKINKINSVIETILEPQVISENFKLLANTVFQNFEIVN